MGRRRGKKGEVPAYEHYTILLRSVLTSPAWSALSPVAQALYPFIRLEWKGPNNNNNCKIRLSARQAGELIGVTKDTAARGFRDLQAKGFIYVTVPGALGVKGVARSPSYEITELLMPTSEKPTGRKLYLQWRKGNDFPVCAHHRNNPTGQNGQ